MKKYSKDLLIFSHAYPLGEKVARVPNIEYDENDSNESPIFNAIGNEIKYDYNFQGEMREVLNQSIN